MGADELQLGRRERQLLEILFRLREATAVQVRSELPDPPTNSAVRGMLRALERKGYISRELSSRRSKFQYLYRPTVRRRVAATSALRRVALTFFDGSAERAAVALLQMSDLRLTAAETKQLQDMITNARRQGR